MTPKNLLDALGNIDPELIEIDTDGIRAREEKKRTFLRVISVAAAFILAVGIILRFALLPTTPGEDPGGDMSPDKVYGAWFSGFFYTEMRSDVYLSAYPLLESLIERTEIGFTFNIGSEDISDCLGTLEYEGRSCEVYRSNVYPDYESVVIVDLGDSYTVFIADGDSLQNSTTMTPSELIEKLDLAATVTAYSFGTTAESDDPRPAIEAIENAVKGKTERADHAAYSRAKYAAWCTLHGTESVSLDGTDFSFKDSDTRSEFAVFYGSTIRIIFVTTSRGFEHMIHYDPDYNLIMIANESFTLTDAEVAEINALLGI